MSHEKRRQASRRRSTTASPLARLARTNQGRFRNLHTRRKARCRLTSAHSILSSLSIAEQMLRNFSGGQPQMSRMASSNLSYRITSHRTAGQDKQQEISDRGEKATRPTHQHSPSLQQVRIKSFWPRHEENFAGTWSGAWPERESTIWGDVHHRYVVVA